MPPAARITDMHTCPMVNPGPVPHVGGPEVSGSPDVITGYMPQGRVDDTLICVPATDKISMGSSNVKVNGKMAARLGDPTVHGGVIVAGCPTVIIGESSQSFTLRSAAASGVPFCEECEKLRKKLEAEKEKLEAPPPEAPPPGSADATAKDGGIFKKLKAKVEEWVPKQKRDELKKLAKIIKPVAKQALAKGKDERSVANWAVAARQALGAANDVDFKSYGDVAVFVYQRNKDKFGDALGPSAEWLMSEKGAKAREIIEMAASGKGKDALTEIKGSLAEHVASKFTDDETVQAIARAAATGDKKAIQGAVAERLGSELIPDNETAQGLLVAAAKGELPSKLGEMSGDAVDSLVSDLVPSQEGQEVLKPAVDWLKGQVSGKVEEKIGALIGGGGA
jgi:uncharacterized Zn-binding protein involved in type VI secretion